MGVVGDEIKKTFNDLVRTLDVILQSLSHGSATIITWRLMTLKPAPLVPAFPSSSISIWQNWHLSFEDLLFLILNISKRVFLLIFQTENYNVHTMFPFILFLYHLPNHPRNTSSVILDSPSTQSATFTVTVLL